jgi:hypothetical protein
VQDKHAVIGIANDADSIFGGGTLFEVTDDPDTFRFGQLVAPATDCSSGVSGAVSRVSSGDVTVRDAPAVPATKHQCKNGGWKTYGTAFKNQGQCVAFVQRGPKP